MVINILPFYRAVYIRGYGGVTHTHPLPNQSKHLPPSMTPLRMTYAHNKINDLTIAVTHDQL